MPCREERNGPAATKMALDMLKEKLISKEEAIMRVKPSQLEELLHPIIDPKAELEQKPLAKGLPAGPGGANGQIVFSANDAVLWQSKAKKYFGARGNQPEDVEGMRAAQAILTARGGNDSSRRFSRARLGKMLYCGLWRFAC